MKSQLFVWFRNFILTLIGCYAKNKQREIGVAQERCVFKTPTGNNGLANTPRGFRRCLVIYMTMTRPESNVSNHDFLSSS